MQPKKNLIVQGVVGACVCYSALTQLPRPRQSGLRRESGGLNEWTGQKPFTYTITMLRYVSLFSNPCTCRNRVSILIIPPLQTVLGSQHVDMIHDLMMRRAQCVNVDNLVISPHDGANTRFWLYVTHSSAIVIIIIESKNDY